MKKNEMINTLQTEKQFLKDNCSVVMIALFGSYDKGLEKADNDVDFFVEFKEVSYNFLMGLYSYLTTALSKFE
ncbi:nucleotidyltransferase family protein [Flavobacterium sp. ZS1P14]|uniref:nucleotidyltransferase family protein n=1 Tax=Flavobacterium sp. ZS1P14 TaxID=3401729 RepID=UPI003AAF4033